MSIVQELDDARTRMRLKSADIGEPCVLLPMDSVSVYRDKDGDWQAIISMATLILMVEDIVRRR